MKELLLTMSVPKQKTSQLLLALVTHLGCFLMQQEWFNALSPDSKNVFTVNTLFPMLRQSQQCTSCY